MNEKLIVINSSPLSSNHVSFYTKKDGVNIILMEIVRRTYNHPDSQGMASISQLEEEVVMEVNRLSIEASFLILLEAALNNANSIIEYGDW